MRKILLFLMVLLLLVVAAIVLFPASLAVDLALKGNPQLRAEQVSGTIWRGRIGSLYRADEPLGSLDWTLHRRPLLDRVISADVALKGPQTDLTASFQRRPDNTLSIRNLRSVMPATVLEPILDAPALQLRGQVVLALDEVELIHLWPRRIIGQGVWQDASVGGAAEARLGELVAEFASRPDGSLAGLLSDRGGPLKLEGEFQISLRGYEVHALLSAPEGDHSLRKALEYIGEPDGEGGRLLLIEGGARQ